MQTFIVKLLANKSFNIARRNQEITNGFCNACKHGHLEIAQMLLNEFDFTLNKVQCNNLFILTSANGHLDVAKWLVDVLYLKEEDVKSNNNNALVFACANGHLEIVKWLIDEHGCLKPTVSIGDPDINNNLPFEYACKNGHLEIAKYLHSYLWVKYKYVTNYYAHSNNNFSLLSACHNGHLHVVVWLVDTFEFGVQHLKNQGHNLPNPFTFTFGHFDVAKYLVQKFHLKIEDAMSITGMLKK